MKVLESLSNLFRKRTSAAALAGTAGIKGPVHISRNTTIWVVVASLLLAIAVGAGIWWWKARHMAAAPAAEVHAPVKAIVNVSPAVVEPGPMHEDAAVQLQAAPETASAVAAATPSAESTVQGVVSHGAVVAAVPGAAVAHEEKLQPAHAAALPLAAPDASKKSQVAENQDAEKKIAPAVALKLSGAVEPMVTDKPDGMVVPPGAVKPQIAEKKKARIRTEPQQKTGYEESKTAVVVETVPTDAGVADMAGSMGKRVKPVSVRQQADIAFRKGVEHMQQGHITDALAAYEACLKLDSTHVAARQAMVALLLEARRMADAERVLREGVKASPEQSVFAMLLARLQIERGVPWSALLTLQNGLPYAKQQPDYHAFMAALLQRLERHQEAVTHYREALQISPDSGLWLMGMGLSLQSLQRVDEARDAFRRAAETRSLNADLQDFVTQRLKEL